MSANITHSETRRAYVVNLGSQAVANYTLAEWPFQFVGGNRRPGQLVSGAMGSDGRRRFDFYWQLADGRVYAEQVDTRERLPRGFHGYVMFSIHDDHVELSWAQRNPVFSRQVREGLKGEEPAIAFIDCGGPYFAHPLMQANWEVRAARVRSNPRVTDPEQSMRNGRCAFGSYFPPKGTDAAKAMDPSVYPTNLKTDHTPAMRQWIDLVQRLIDDDVVSSSNTPVRVK